MSTDLLESFDLAFSEIPKKPDIYTFFMEMVDKLGHEKFSRRMLYTYGSRSYNNYLDYQLLACKFANLFDKLANSTWTTNFSSEMNNFVGDCWEEVDDIVTNLFFDDRHDMYQNIPYSLDKISEKFSASDKEKLWEKISNILIESFQEVPGIEIHSFSYYEKQKRFYDVIHKKE